MWTGCARVSTTDQSPKLQRDTFRRAGCENMLTTKASSAKADRPGLARLLHEALRRGDPPAASDIDRLIRSLDKLVTTAEGFEDRGIGPASSITGIDATTAGGVLVPVQAGVRHPCCRRPR